MWNAFTQPEPLKRWWGTPGSSIEIARHELKPGGLFHYCIKFPDGRAMWARFIFREIVAPERLVWLMASATSTGASRATLDAQASAGDASESVSEV